MMNFYQAAKLKDLLCPCG